MTPLTFPGGLYGFPGPLDFALRRTARAGLYLLLGRSEHAPSLAVVDPFPLFPGYEVELSAAQLEAIDADARDPVGVFAIVVPDPAGAWTANLRGPLVVNAAKGTGAQIALAQDCWSVRQAFTPGWADAVEARSSMDRGSSGRPGSRNESIDGSKKLHRIAG